ncbi:unnamed protein product [Strongylus vulgaris]|uniref:Uncharacterized protein n=1 Tax=Strongylus vulgaris TaxID=40348 RepID=A0A3P7IZS6_STRVU|nr:unnamed protein product [Strongylus vulgaris]
MHKYDASIATHKIIEDDASRQPGSLGKSPSLPAQKMLVQRGPGATGSVMKVVRGTGPGQQILRVVRPLSSVAGGATLPTVVKPGPGAKTIFLSKGGTQQKVMYVQGGVPVAPPGVMLSRAGVAMTGGVDQQGTLPIAPHQQSSISTQGTTYTAPSNSRQNDEVCLIHLRA